MQHANISHKEHCNYSDKITMKALILCVSFFFSVPGFANPIETLIERVRSTLDDINDNSSCKGCKMDDQVANLGEALSCEALTDQFCAQVFSLENKGNLQLSTGSITSGNSPKSDIALAKKADLEALANSEANLKPDLKAVLAPHLSKLRGFLKEEDDSKKWLNSIADIELAVKRGIEEVAENRAAAINPKVKDKSWTHTRKEELALRKSKEDAYYDLVTAKYENHPNWVRVKKNFQDIQASLREIVNGLDLPAHEKEEILTTINTAQLKLPPPSFNEKVEFPMPDCSTTSVNAYYHAGLHYFTFCAGYFNTNLSDSGLYYIMAHEIAHSIDPGRRITAMQGRDYSAKVMTALMEKNGQAYSCDEWAKVKAELEKHVKNLDAPKNVWAKLSNCLVDRSKLKPIDNDIYEEKSDEFATLSVGGNADDKDFVKLSDPTITKNYRKLTNEKYLNPQALTDFDMEWKRSRIPFANYDRIPFLFTQEYVCQDKSKGEDTRFEKAIQATKDLDTIYQKADLKFQGQESSQLIPIGRAKQSHEYFADWLALQSFASFLEKRNTIKERRDDAVLATALFCDPPVDNPNKSTIQKKFSMEAHPSNRPRRLSLFTSRIRELLGCKMTGNSANTGNFGECKYER
jgi:hypothetical protein